MSHSTIVYLDANASARVHPAAWQAYATAAQLLGHPHATHALGQQAADCLEVARANVAQAVKAEACEIVFTNGGTEANALGLHGLLAGASVGTHVVCSSIEHPAVHQVLQHLQRQLGFEITWIPTNSNGVIDTPQFLTSIRPNTRLVSLMAANNETGVLQPIVEIANVCRSQNIRMHIDAVQALGRIPLDVRTLGVDTMALAGHKIGAVGGIGALYRKKGVPFAPWWQNKDHTDPLPDDSMHVAGATSFAAALQHAPSQSMLEQIAQLRDDFEKTLANRIADIDIVGRVAPRLPNTSCVRFIGCEGDGLMMVLDLTHFCVSTGSACSSGSIEPAKSLLAMGYQPKQAKEALRFSWDIHSLHTYSESMLNQLVSTLAKAVSHMRASTPS